MINHRKKDKGVDDHFVENNFCHGHPYSLAIFSEAT